MLEKLKYIGKLGLVGAIFGGGIFLSEKSGLTEAFTQYWDIQHKVYSKMDDLRICNYPHNNNESEDEKNFRLKKYKIIADIGLGFTYLVLAGGVGFIVNDYLHKKRANSLGKRTN